MEWEALTREGQHYNLILKAVTRTAQMSKLREENEGMERMEHQNGL